MSSFLLRILAILLLSTMLACSAATATAVGIPDPTLDAPLAATKGEQTAVFAGGCFWGIQAVFQHVKGVKSATAGYSGGAAQTAHYEMVSTGETGHAESVQVIYDPSQVTYGQLLKVFFSVAHDPTELNRQGPDTGTQYRSAIFYSTEEQKRIAEAYINQLNQAKIFNRTIVTQVVAFNSFYQAEGYHQDYAVKHPDDPYIATNDLPKVENLRKQLPNLYKAK
jgi:peptide-methionine (S)-S-oxide reductase